MEDGGEGERENGVRKIRDHWVKSVIIWYGVETTI